MKPLAEIDILPLFPDKSFPAISFNPWLRKVRNFDRKIKLILSVALEGEWVMSEAGVFTSGRAISTLDDHHIKRTWYDHQVSLVTHLLQQGAYL